MKRTYEAWLEEDDERGAITLGTIDVIVDHRAKDLLGPEAKLLHRIVADTPEEAKAVLHVKMGWDPYMPPGPAAPCPLSCGALYYPQGSGECPNCGPIS